MIIVFLEDIFHTPFLTFTELDMWFPWPSDMEKYLNLFSLVTSSPPYSPTRVEDGASLSLNKVLIFRVELKNLFKVWDSNFVGLPIYLMLRFVNKR